MLLFTSPPGGCVTSPILQLFLSRQLLTTHHFKSSPIIFSLAFNMHQQHCYLIMTYIYIDPFVHLPLTLILRRLQ